ncbi:barstar family protein [Deinococcus humi]|uniref:RNAse (Barnase) inhibitor barstar n=1 Tax=Deinococcus humi TaxID=662880 RepID=A0A7W8K013_9DEIO|nr:barstar family protein [Deinococcus humi]MBB5366145.1 RNAse (barnase) inhibitor barstar [Deinococcus humi]GGO40286.1 hypothetical protein GCM10008949_49630 [Deinococcus humi]
MADRDKHLRFDLDARVMTTAKEFHSEIARKMRFPDYCGGGMNALFDVLTDLDWFDFNSLEINIQNSIFLLVDEPPEFRRALQEVLDDVSQYWSQPLELGEAWDHPAIEFKVTYAAYQLDLL